MAGTRSTTRPAKLHAADPAALSAAFPQALLCQHTPVVPQQHEWDCGYANLHALLEGDLHSAEYDVPSLQGLVERAWRAGYDTRASLDYGGRLIGRTGRPAWIGAREVLAVLSAGGRDACLIEVMATPRVNEATVDAKRRAGAAAFDAVVACLRAAAAAGLGRPPPLFVQGSTHSYVVIGALCEGGERLLLVRDPASAAGDVRLVRASALRRTLQVVALWPTAAEGPRGRAAAERAGEPEPAAKYSCDGWAYAAWFAPRFE